MKGRDGDGRQLLPTWRDSDDSWPCADPKNSPPPPPISPLSPYPYFALSVFTLPALISLSRNMETFLCPSSILGQTTALFFLLSGVRRCGSEAEWSSSRVRNRLKVELHHWHEPVTRSSRM
ncbi:hypothetical protein ElyMa_001244400 [Elysia marginata]|uniref:Uncharacterized protein n=1 Tax=Elysia marginata TaxID=1093978 RepID=A0AAV4I9T7_9GAST|nr:hypothetical protein ElyMa_001244400 [Elysia marginata]